jgi:cytidyltransferase-like protein
MNRIVLVTGGFDPLHSGHIAYFEAAKRLGDMLIVGVNSDDWLKRKKGVEFMPFTERSKIVESLKSVDSILEFDDTDGSACDAIQQVLDMYSYSDVIFANGGDRTDDNIPEMRIQDERLTFEFGVGGEDKKNSSSWILQEWKSPKTERVWGYYRNLHSDGPEVKVKELAVNPHSQLSMQKHKHRSEHWHVSEGVATVNLDDPENPRTVELQKHDTLEIPVDTWHQLCNNTENELRVVEIQYGSNCIEEDIERHGVDPYYGMTEEEKNEYDLDYSN